VRGRIFEAIAERPGTARRDRGAGAGEEGRRLLKAVMPGRIVRVLVHPGEKVTRGQGIIVVEAMKMENELASPKDGTVTGILVSESDRVESGAPLVVIE
jgi:biotin carboxyl carrier protein